MRPTCRPCWLAKGLLTLLPLGHVLWCFVRAPESPPWPLLSFAVWQQHQQDNSVTVHLPRCRTARKNPARWHDNLPWCAVSPPATGDVRSRGAQVASGKGVHAFFVCTVSQEAGHRGVRSGGAEVAAGKGMQGLRHHCGAPAGQKGARRCAPRVSIAKYTARLLAMVCIAQVLLAAAGCIGRRACGAAHCPCCPTLRAGCPFLHRPNGFATAGLGNDSFFPSFARRHWLPEAVQALAAKIPGWRGAKPEVPPGRVPGPRPAEGTVSLE